MQMFAEAPAPRATLNCAGVELAYKWKRCKPGTSERWWRYYLSGRPPLGGHIHVHPSNGQART